MLLVSTTSVALHMSMILYFQVSQSEGNVFIPQFRWLKRATTTVELEQ
jgi:hypothetical protein